MTEAPSPWERQPNEGQRAFAAFQCYRDLGKDRTHQKVAEELGVSHSAITKHSEKWKWKARIIAFEDYMNRKLIEAKIKAIDEMVQRHAQVSLINQKVLIKPAQALLKKNEAEFDGMDIDKLMNYSLKAAAVLNSIVDIERKSRGEPDQIIKQDLTSGGDKIKVILPPLTKQNLPEQEEDDL